MKAETLAEMLQVLRSLRFNGYPTLDVIKEELNHRHETEMDALDEAGAEYIKHKDYLEKQLGLIEGCLELIAHLEELE